MKTFSKTQLKLFHQLADGQCHKGNKLGNLLGLSGAAVSKHINQLITQGLPVQCLPQQQYQLTHPMIPLDETVIRQHLEAKRFVKPIDLHLLATVDSTNQYLKQDIVHDSTLTFCCAEKQTHGRGRFGRSWLSPFGENIYCSSRWIFPCRLSHLSGLSLVVGLAILASFEKHFFYHDLQIKWPNDILWNNKKLGGILIESIAETNQSAQIIIGIGLNINTATHQHPLAGRPWCSLYEITQTRWDRNDLLANLIYHLNQFIEQFLIDGFAALIPYWQKVDYLKGKWITVSNPTSTKSGIACGINELGQLCLQDEQGVMYYLSSGETSLKDWIERID